MVAYVNPDGDEIGSTGNKKAVEFLVRHDHQSVQRYNCKRQLWARNGNGGL